MSGRNSREHRQVTRYTGAPQPGRRRQPVVRHPVGYQMGPYGQVPGYQMGSYGQMVPYQMPYQIINNYQTINYQRAGYRSRGHAMQCPHVQRAISQHGISSNSSLASFLGMLASGFTIAASLVSIGIVL